MGENDHPAQKADHLFDTRAPDALEQHHKTRTLLNDYNGSASNDPAYRETLLQALLGRCDAGVWIEPPFFCDDGKNIQIGAGVFINFNCVILDGATVEIGAGTLLGPAVQIYATTHPMASHERIFKRNGVPAYHTSATPISIGENVWVGGGVIVLPGVSIGDGTTVGAGAVVTEDLPAHVFAAGNPCKIIRHL